MKRISRRRFTELLALGALAGCTMPPAPKQQPVGWTLYSPDRYGAPTGALIPWRLVAMSDLIVRGTITVSSEAASALAQPTNKIISLPLSISHSFKGDNALRSVEINYWPDNEYGPRPATILAASKSEAVAFLVLSHENENANGPYYFAGLNDSPLLPTSPTIDEALAAEVSQQESLVIRIAEYLVDHIPPNDGYVAALIEQLLVESKAYDASRELLSLGPAYAAALVRHLDDRRLIAIRTFAVPAPPGNFESIIQYGPESVVDLVSYILRHTTNDDLGDTVNGGAERARRRVVDAWRVWLGRSLRLQAG